MLHFDVSGKGFMDPCTFRTAGSTLDVTHMKHSILLLLLVFNPPRLFSQVPEHSALVDESVLALPEGMRAEASVLAFGEDGKLLSVKQGSGPIVCLSDDPSRDGFHVACYHRELDPFMARGRELRKLGKERAEIMEIREREIEEGALTLPTHPAALYTLSGPEGCYDRTTSTLCEARRLYVVYVPYATQESTGLSTDAAKGVPWLMDPGKPWAHIMMVPPE